MTITPVSSSPSCTYCADWARGFAAGYARGREAGFSEGALAGAIEGPAHPAIVDSVNRIFAGWDGHEAALERSVIRFKDWHAAAREEVARDESRAA